MPCFLMQLRQLCKISGLNVSFDAENARDSFYRATTGFVLDDCSRCVLSQANFFWMFFQLFLATICYRRTCSFNYFLLNNYFHFIAYSICMVLIFLFVGKNSRRHGSSTNQWRESKKFSCWSCYKYWAGQVPCCHTCLCISCGSHSCVPLAMLGMDVARVLDMFMILHTYQSCWFYLYIAPRL